MSQPETLRSVPLTKRQQLKEQLHTLALCVGLRPAARRLGINEKTATVWSFREKWNLAEVFSIAAAPMRSQGGGKSREVSASAVIEESFREQSEDTRLYLSSAALKASHAAATKDGAALLGKIESQSVLNTARTADVVHGWTAARQSPLVQIANVTLPTPVEESERRATDAKLDAITKLLSTPKP